MFGKYRVSNGISWCGRTKGDKNNCYKTNSSRSYWEINMKSEHFDQSVSQSPSQLASHSFRQPVSQSASRLVGQSASRPVGQSVSRPVGPSARWPLSAGQPVSQSPSQLCLIASGIVRQSGVYFPTLRLFSVSLVPWFPPVPLL